MRSTILLWAMILGCSLLAPHLAMASSINLLEYQSYMPAARRSCTVLAKKILSHDKRFQKMDVIFLGLDAWGGPGAIGSPPLYRGLNIPQFNRLEGQGRLHDMRGWHTFMFRCELENSFQTAKYFYY